MTSRLRESASAIREAERRATLGDIARQVNHDLRNGLTPIRNVVRHLGELSDTEPAALPAVFAERRRTLESSISYLDELATRYARLSPRSANERCDVGAIVRQVASDLSDTGSVPIQVKAVGGAWVLGDSVVLRRLVENLIRNAFQSGSDDNRVDVSVSVVPAGASDSRDADGVDRVVRLSISDTGAGMSEETRARIFDDFFTTKAEGTGLGLSIVRRIAMDLQGSISVESELGEGSTFTVEFPQCP
jgi:signal transduction histidine kinase